MHPRRFARALPLLAALAGAGTPVAADTPAAPPVIRYTLTQPAALGANFDVERSTHPWAAYARARRAALEALIAAGRWNGANDDFEVELAGHEALLAAWKATGPAAHLPGIDAEGAGELDALQRVADAGFLEEYVFERYLKPGWTIPASLIPRIDDNGYAHWLQANGDLPTPSSGAMAVVDGAPARPPVPGATLALPNRYAPGEMPCAESSAPLLAGVAAWRAEAAHLPGAPLTLPETGAQLTRGLRRPSHATRGATFVPPTPAVYLFFAGYCAVDVEDYAAAEPLLREAVELMPWWSSAQLELAQVAIRQQHYDEADAIVEDVLTNEQDPCAIANAWRKRGYVRFDQGRLEDSRAAYLKSLVYDPDSELARSELALLNQQITAHGGKAEEWTPLPGSQLTTTCHAGQPSPGI